MQLTTEILHSVTHTLAERDEALHHVFTQFGYPPLWAREPGFSTLTHIILEQQVSLASANAAFARLKEQLDGTVTPSGFLGLDDDTLRTIGYSRQKMHYTRLLAEAVQSGAFDIDGLANLSDEAARDSLCTLKGIGHWTSDVYLSECLLRPDILPPGDIALLEAFKVIKGLEKRPDHTTFTAMTEHWRPWRSVGIRLLWHYYLSVRAKP